MSTKKQKIRKQFLMQGKVSLLQGNQAKCFLPDCDTWRNLSDTFQLSADGRSVCGIRTLYLIRRAVPEEFVGLQNFRILLYESE